MMSSMVILKSKQDVRFAEKVKTITVVPVQQQQNGLDCGVFVITYVSSLTFMNDPNITFHTIIMCPNLINVLSLVKWNNFQVLFSHRNVLIKISVRLVHVVSLEVSHMK